MPIRITTFAILVATLLLAPSVAIADDALIGTWRVESSIPDGSQEESKVGELIIFSDSAILDSVSEDQPALFYEVNTDVLPHAIDLMLPHNPNFRIKGIYKIEEDTLTICIRNLFSQLEDRDRMRPIEFSSTGENDCLLQTLSRIEE